MNMNNQLLHTPEGVRDIYAEECARKLAVEQKIQHVFSLYGYQSIETPVFEFFDIFKKERGSVGSQGMYKFFDRDNNTLVLRPDMTPPIARCVAKYYMDETKPLRLCYLGPTFINGTSYQGRLKESTQTGAELIGDDTADADAEMIAMVIDALKETGLKEFQVELGQVEFYRGLVEESGMNEETQEQLRILIENKNYFGVEELLDNCGVKEETKAAFRVLEELTGGIEIMECAKKIVSCEKALRAVERLSETYEILVSYGVEKYITFDLSMSGTYGYYTGIIFRGYTYGTGDAIVKGGRYDHLVEKFGKEFPSIGFAIVIDELMGAISRQKLEIPYHQKNTLILYEESERSRAIALAKEFRLAEKPTELVKKSDDRFLDEYVSYARQNFCGGMFYLKREDEILMTNLLTDEKKTVGWEEII